MCSGIGPRSQLAAAKRAAARMNALSRVYVGFKVRTDAC